MGGNEDEQAAKTRREKTWAIEKGNGERTSKKKQPTFSQELCKGRAVSILVTRPITGLGIGPDKRTTGRYRSKTRGQPGNYSKVGKKRHALELY